MYQIPTRGVPEEEQPNLYREEYHGDDNDQHNPLHLCHLMGW
jgi:hypothetical protein